MLRDQRQVIEAVGALGLQPEGALQAAPGSVVVPELEQDLALETTVDAHLGVRLDGSAQQEERPLEVIQVEERLGLEVVDLRLGAGIERVAQQAVRKLRALSNCWNSSTSISIRFR